MNTITIDNEITLFETGALEVAYPPLDFALSNWADASTDPTSDRRDDLEHDKTKAVHDFFEWICTSP